MPERLWPLVCGASTPDRHVGSQAEVSGFLPPPSVPELSHHQGGPWFLGTHPLLSSAASCGDFSYLCCLYTRMPPAPISHQTHQSPCSVPGIMSVLSEAQPALSELLANPSLPILTLPRPSPCFKALTQPPRPTFWTPNCFTWHLSPVIRFPAITSSPATTPFCPHTLQPSNSTYGTGTLMLPPHHSWTLYTLLCLKYPPPLFYLAKS